MALLRPDPTFYPSPRLAMQGPAERLAYVAALRLARFSNTNEHSDWESAHHVFTYTNAIHQIFKRIENAGIDGDVMSVRCVLGFQPASRKVSQAKRG